MCNDPLVALEQQLALRVAIGGLVLQRGVGALGQDDHALEACIADPAGREVQRSLVHFHRRALGYEEHFCVLKAVGIVLDLPHMAQDQHKVRDSHIDLAALVVLKAVPGGVAAVAIAHFNGHIAVEFLLHFGAHRQGFHLRDAGHIDVAVLRDGGVLLHVSDHLAEIVSLDHAAVGGEFRAQHTGDRNIVDLVQML